MDQKKNISSSSFDWMQLSVELICLRINTTLLFLFLREEKKREEPFSLEVSDLP